RVLRVCTHLWCVVAPCLGGLLPRPRRGISGFGREGEEPAGEATQPFSEARRCRGFHGPEGKAGASHGQPGDRAWDRRTLPTFDRSAARSAPFLQTTGMHRARIE